MSDITEIPPPESSDAYEPVAANELFAAVQSEARPEYETDTRQLKTLPHSVEAERSLLGGMMLSENAWDAIAELVTDRDFYFNRHAHIYLSLIHI